jgi:hypothetical protein
MRPSFAEPLHVSILQRFTVRMAIAEEAAMNTLCRILSALILCSLCVWPLAPAIGRAAPAGASFGLYLTQGVDLMPLDPSSLADVPFGADINLGDASLPESPLIVSSPHGSAIATISYSPFLVRVFDTRTGAARATFKPTVTMDVFGISDDGSQLYGLLPQQGRSATWYIMDGKDGHVMSRTPVAQWGYAPILYDPPTHRLYVMNLSQATFNGHNGPRTPSIVAYNTLAGRIVGRLTLTGVQAGSWTTKRMVGGHPVVRMQQPGFALSPDGRMLAVLDGSRNVLLTIDAHSLTLERTVSLSQPQDLVERLGEWLGLIPAIAQAKNFVGTNVDIHFSTDGRRLYETAFTGTLGAGNHYSYSYQGLRLIDVAGGQIVAQSLSGKSVSDVQPAPDGSAVYAISPAGGAAQNCLCVLRLDSTTLQIEAQRPIGPGASIFVAPDPARSLGCQPPSPVTPSSPMNPTLPEIHGAAPRADLWALVFQPMPIRANQAVKIVWRMTGTAGLTLTAQSAAGKTIAPMQGPQAHLGSNWDRPGDEWGTEFVFPQPGCWRVHATRATTAGDVWFQVASGANVNG